MNRRLLFSQVCNLRGQSCCEASLISSQQEQQPQQEATRPPSSVSAGTVSALRLSSSWKKGGQSQQSAGTHWPPTGESKNSLLDSVFVEPGRRLGRFAKWGAHISFVGCLRPGLWVTTRLVQPVLQHGYSRSAAMAANCMSNSDLTTVEGWPCRGPWPAWTLMWTSEQRTNRRPNSTPPKMTQLNIVMAVAASKWVFLVRSVLCGAFRRSVDWNLNRNKPFVTYWGGSDHNLLSSQCSSKMKHLNVVDLLPKVNPGWRLEALEGAVITQPAYHRRFGSLFS